MVSEKIKEKIKDKNGKISHVPIADRLHKDIIYKILKDHGSLLQLESKMYEGGKSKSPRYKDMVEVVKTMRDTYHPKYISQNFRTYLAERWHGKETLDVLFGSDNNPKNRFSNLAETLQEKILPVERVLDRIASRDRMQLQKFQTPEGDYMSEFIQKIRN